MHGFKNQTVRSDRFDREPGSKAVQFFKKTRNSKKKQAKTGNHRFNRINWELDWFDQFLTGLNI